jgi:hypothetical protein
MAAGWMKNARKQKSLGTRILEPNGLGEKAGKHSDAILNLILTDCIDKAD